MNYAKLTKELYSACCRLHITCISFVEPFRALAPFLRSFRTPHLPAPIHTTSLYVLIANLHRSHSMDTPQETSLRNLFTTAKVKRTELESFASSTDPTYQENVRSAIECLEQCRKLADRVSLFSPNEALEDIASADLQ